MKNLIWMDEYITLRGYSLCLQKFEIYHINEEIELNFSSVYPFKNCLIGRVTSLCLLVAWSVGQPVCWLVDLL